MSLVRIFLNHLIPSAFLAILPKCKYFELILYISGKIVNAIRRYPDMRADIMYEDYVVVPQYYRSGCILVQKKSNRNEKQ